ncbi:hypothetical protein [Streptomyces sp. NPDC047974]|uniref:hypothetical protein n=1 Tax=Streptomyces sp. NPDC047974 TaxID=3154343 RepID=UPI003403535D
MIALRLTVVVLVHGRRPLAWLGLATTVMLVCVWPAGWLIRLDVLAAFLGVPLCVVVHEYGHARAALLLGARTLRAEWSGGSMAVSHEDLGAPRNLLVALSGPVTSGAAGGAAVTAGLALAWPPLFVLGLVVALPAGTLIPPGHDARTAWSQARQWARSAGAEPSPGS